MMNRAVDDLIKKIVSFVAVSAKDVSVFVDKVEYKGKKIPGVRIEYFCFDRESPHVSNFVPKVLCESGKYRAAKEASIKSLSLLANKVNETVTMRDTLANEYAEGF